MSIYICLTWWCGWQVHHVSTSKVQWSIVSSGLYHKKMNTVLFLFVLPCYFFVEQCIIQPYSSQLHCWHWDIYIYVYPMHKYILINLVYCAGTPTNGFYPSIPEPGGCNTNPWHPLPHPSQNTHIIMAQFQALSCTAACWDSDKSKNNQ